MAGTRLDSIFRQAALRSGFKLSTGAVTRKAPKTSGGNIFKTAARFYGGLLGGKKKKPGFTPPVGRPKLKIGVPGGMGPFGDKKLQESEAAKQHGVKVRRGS